LHSWAELDAFIFSTCARLHVPGCGYRIAFFKKI